MNSTSVRKMFVLTGKRGGFGAMKPMLRLLRDNPFFELQLVVTDQHLDERFGWTIIEVTREFRVAAAVELEQHDSTPLARARALGICASRMAETLDKLRSDCCVLYGDRGEVLATAMAATTLGIPIAHIQGGDVSGSVDEQMRHAVTKLAHLHFPSTSASAERIIRMGEESWRVHVVGDNHLDLIAAGEFLPAAEVAAALHLDLSQPVIVVLQHPETTQPEAAYQQMVETLTPVMATGLQTVIIYPCSDVGYEGIVRAIDDVAIGGQCRVHRNLDAPMFWGLLATSSVLVGNSSAGIIEAPSFRLPTINIGRRQENRMHSNNVIHVPHDRDEIARALHQALHDQEYRKTMRDCLQPYGDGHAGERIVNVLRDVSLDQKLLVKRMTY